MTYFRMNPDCPIVIVSDRPSITFVWTKCCGYCTCVHYISACTNHVTILLRGISNVGLVLPVVSLFLCLCARGKAEQQFSSIELHHYM